jgi:adenosylcobyric acid synthase
VRILEERGGVPVLGVIPWLRDHGIPEEDGAGLDDPARSPILGVTTDPSVDIAVIKLPRIANFDDFDPLAAEAGVRVRFVQAPNNLGRPTAIILPGTKHTLADLAWLRANGLADALLGLAAQGVALVGICGGYQMLGHSISDPDGVEGGGDAAGLRLLPVRVIFRGAKVTQQAVAHPLGRWPWLTAAEPLTGYEIHAGQAETPAPLLELRRADSSHTLDGTAAPDGRIWGTHLHGLFHNDDFRRAWLASLGWQAPARPTPYLARKAAGYDRLADALEAALDVRRLDAIIGL